MAARRGLISYDGLPRSSGGAHGLGRLPPSEAWKAFQKFLSACTTATQPKRVSMSINETPDVDPEKIQSLRDSARKMLGVRGRPQRGKDFGERGRMYSWNLSVAQADTAVEWLSEASPLAANWLGGPAKLALDFEFRLKSPSGVELPFQRSADYFGQIYDGYGILLGESGCRLTVAARSALSLVMFLPFEEPDDEFWEYVDFLQENLLMKFSSKHWKHWKLTKKGNVYTNRHIAPPSA